MTTYESMSLMISFSGLIVSVIVLSLLFLRKKSKPPLPSKHVSGLLLHYANRL
ncbi:putative holin-like toxin [Lysinibacillus fusiformis]|uniref:putative holin-like toxin n=1 Tax=Lysinibacillus fusiformis TaxID=28031 RepID=UPI003AF32A60